MGVVGGCTFGVAGLTTPAGEVATGGEGVGVFRAKNPLTEGQELGVVGASPLGVAVVSTVCGEVVAGVEWGVGVWRCAGGSVCWWWEEVARGRACLGRLVGTRVVVVSSTRSSSLATAMSRAAPGA